MTTRGKVGIVAAVPLAAIASPAHAGMASFSLTELAGARIDAISFFVLTFILCAFVVRWSWNSLRDVFPSLPVIRFKHALCLMLLSGLLLYVILTMISGARELMTPGAWEKSGITYRLRSEEDAHAPRSTDAEAPSHRALRRLYANLIAYAGEHNGAFPASPETSGFESSVWSGINRDGHRFSYVGWLGTDAQPERILAYEPVSSGATRHVLQVDGEIVRMSAGALKARLKGELANIRPATTPEAPR